MNPRISSVLAQGFKPDQILDFLIRKFPKHSERIKSALAQGFTADQIVSFLGGGRKELAREKPVYTEGAETRAIDIGRRENVNQKALQGAATIAAPFVARAAMPLANAALSRVVPANLLPYVEGAIGTNLQGQTPQNTSQTPVDLSRASSEVPPVNAQPPLAAQPNIAQPPQPPQDKAISINPTEILKKNNLTDKIDQLITSGNDVEGITGFFRKFHPDVVKKLEKEGQQDFENIVNSYVADKGKPEKKQDIETSAPIKSPENVANTLGNQPISQESVQLHEETPKIEKHSTVATPNGVGEVKEIRNGKALVEVDGKLHKVPEDELIAPPMSEIDLADLYEDLVSGIEKQTGQQVSRNVDWAGYDPNTNELAYKPHGSDKLYAYEDISPEDVEILTSLLTQRKSTGQNFIGAWAAGTTSPIGAAMYQLIQKLQKERGGKGNEYKNRYDTIYDALEPAKIAAKKRHAERKKKAKKPGTP